MKTLNKVQLIGNLGTDPRIHQFEDGRISASLSLATETSWQNKKKGNEKEEDKQDSSRDYKDQKNQKLKEKDKKKLKLNLLKKDKTVQKTEQDGQDEQDKQNKKADWHKIICYGRLAEMAKMYLRCGSKIYVEGYLKHRTWENEEAQKQWMTEVIARELIIFSPFKKYEKNKQNKIDKLKVKNTDEDIDEDENYEDEETQGNEKYNDEEDDSYDEEAEEYEE